MRLPRRHGAIDAASGVAALAVCLAIVTHAHGVEPAAVSGSGTISGTATMPYWQAPALPSAVIHGGAIPAGWQPQAVPYQGVGPDGKPLTMYVAPTYVFTYQSGPPVLAAAPVNRLPPAATPTSAPYGASGWNYQAQGATAVPVALPPATVARYQPAPYQFPPDARALSGTPIAPPATPLPGPPRVPAQQAPFGSAPAPPPFGFSPAPAPYGAAPAQPIAAPPPQWVPSNELPPPGVAPPQTAG